MARGWARSFRWAALDIEMGRCLRKAEGDLEGLRTGALHQIMHTVRQDAGVSAGLPQEHTP